MPRYFRLAFLLGFLSSCQQNETEKHTVSPHHPSSGNETFNALLHTNTAPLADDTSYSLGLTSLNQEIYSASYDSGTNWMTRIVFRPEFMPNIQPTDFVSFATNFTDNHYDWLGVTSSELSLAPQPIAHPNQSLTILTFHREHHGISVTRAFIQYIFRKNQTGWHLTELVNRTYGVIDLPPEPERLADIPFIIEQTGLDAVTAVFNEPAIHISRGTDGSPLFVHATRIQLKDETGEVFDVVASNADDSLLDARSRKVWAKSVSAEVFDRSYFFNDVKTFPLAGATINGLRADANGKVETNDNTLNILLNGSVRVRDASNRGVDYSLAFTAPNENYVIKQDPETMAALNVHVSMSRLLDFVGNYLNINQVPRLAQPLFAFVNILDSCNAFYDGRSINFFLPGNGCANTAHVNDIIYHEWGHALDDYTGTQQNGNGIADGAFSEGIGDIVSALMTGNSDLAPGFFLNSADPIRRLRNNVTYPPANDQERLVHNEGRIIGGSFWDSRRYFVLRHGEVAGNDSIAKLFFPHLLSTDFYTDSYAAFLRLDDDDNNPQTRSPNFCSINRGFASHNLAEPVANCLDPDPGITVSIEEDDDDGDVLIHASSFGATNIVICRDDVATCSSGDEGYLSLTPNRKADNQPELTSAGKLKYEASAKMSISDEAVYTLISIDSDNIAYGRKVISFASYEEDE